MKNISVLRFSATYIIDLTVIRFGELSVHDHLSTLSLSRWSILQLLQVCSNESPYLINVSLRQFTKISYLSKNRQHLESNECFHESFVGMSSANERSRYNITLYLIGWAHTQNAPCVSWSSFHLDIWKSAMTLQKYWTLTSQIVSRVLYNSLLWNLRYSQ